MTPKTSKNEIRHKHRLCLITLDPDHTSIIDIDDLERIWRYKWRAVKSGRCYYAKTTVGPPHHQVDLSLHRMIAHTPVGMVCHHRNRNSLDNRACNLVNMTKKAHDTLHANNNLKIKYSDTYRGENTPPTVSEGGIDPT